MKLTGRVLWWCDREENGIILDQSGNEFYFDRSVIDKLPKGSIKRKATVTFILNESITDCLCARDVSFVRAKGRVKTDGSGFVEKGVH